MAYVMECDLYARIECNDQSQFEFLSLMLGPDDSEKPMFQDEVAAEFALLFEIFEYVDVPQTLECNFEIKTLLVHWFVRDSHEAKSLFSNLARSGVKSCYALLWFCVDELILLCMNSDITTNYTDGWEGETWHKAKQSSANMLEVLEEIATTHGVNEIKKNSLDQDAVIEIIDRLQEEGYLLNTGESPENMLGIGGSFWQEQGQFCYRIEEAAVPWSEDLNSFREFFENAICEIAKVSQIEGSYEIDWKNSNLEQAEIALSVRFKDMVFEIEWEQEDDYILSNFTLPITRVFEKRTSGKFLALDGGMNVGDRLLFLKNSVTDIFTTAF